MVRYTCTFIFDRPSPRTLSYCAPLPLSSVTALSILSRKFLTSPWRSDFPYTWTGASGDTCCHGNTSNWIQMCVHILEIFRMCLQIQHNARYWFWISKNCDWICIGRTWSSTCRRRSWNAKCCVLLSDINKSFNLSIVILVMPLFVRHLAFSNTETKFV